ncbi:hypothetical protein GWI33_007907 [Rhynchophorus ferrugineus]|uniref:Uncharacterized protein n=1 Tax=Rhynchophorus ferrugineus TaxID=354439 RepID=A0A834IDP0_RHYFE|nr:hypothetical protein GWI33_007907 [Rhynchophorus ferrugineus]
MRYIVRDQQKRNLSIKKAISQKIPVSTTRNIARSARKKTRMEKMPPPPPIVLFTFWSGQLVDLSRGQQKAAAPPAYRNKRMSDGRPSLICSVSRTVFRGRPNEGATLCRLCCSDRSRIDFINFIFPFAGIWRWVDSNFSYNWQANMTLVSSYNTGVNIVPNK